jgi:hypothetical protein
MRNYLFFRFLYFVFSRGLVKALKAVSCSVLGGNYHGQSLPEKKSWDTPGFSTRIPAVDLGQIHCVGWRSQETAQLLALSYRIINEERA